ncbi:MAG: Gfo/Idh/MocA family oxidoreductase [Kiritimatiellae bacterium]|nr:Gfo/Idh/MocA family oxidoreductase [Kiritimatiellia bacterium]
MTSPVWSRRAALRALGALAAPSIVPCRVLGRGGAVAPSERIGIAVIGAGERGRGHVQEFGGFPETRIAAICDVDIQKARSLRDWATVQRRVEADCAVTQDFRELIGHPDVDAVAIAAPEHWHAFIAIAAMRAGRDVYCEKALARTVAEGRAICTTVRETGRVLQSGMQQRSDPRFRFACELALNGHLGRLHTVTVAVPGGHLRLREGVRALHLPVAPPPPTLDYDLWLGPAPMKPHRQGICSYYWYFFSDYCAGWMQSWGVHHLDIALWGAPSLGRDRIAVEGTAVFLEEGDPDVPFGWDITVTAADGLRLRFYDDSRSPYGHGVRFEGDRGWVHVVRGAIRAEPAALLETVIRPDQTRLRVSTHHIGDFLQCIRTRREPVAPAEACQAATTLSLVCDIAARCGRRLTWDWNTERFVGDPSADRHLARAPRAPWTLG